LSTIATSRLRRSYVAAPDDRAGRWLLPALVFAAMAFNLVLCFANTRFLTVGNLHVIACEALIISIAFLASHRSLQPSHVLLLSGTMMFALALASIRVAFGLEASINIKIVRDLMIPIVFFLLGRQAKDAKSADFVVRVAAAVVLVLALFEYFFVEAFTQSFNVAKYYIARGTMEAREALQSADLFISGMRPAGHEGGRNLLPFLGDHRVSSLFLEPVSMGNFGIIVFLWGLVRSKFEHRLYVGLMTAGLVFIVLADSRFGAYFCLMSLVIVLLPASLATIAVGMLPLAALAVLLIVPFVVTGSYDPQHRYVDNGFMGRLMLSGQILGEFDALNWLGLEPLPRAAYDSGYSYILEGIGVIGVAAAWYLFMSLQGRSRQFQAFRNVAAMYYAVILCISNSPFTIKTASLLWFLIGVLAHEPERDRPAAAGAAARNRRRA
jgi:putative polymerase